jgi:hypothetical protein
MALRVPKAELPGELRDIQARQLLRVAHHVDPGDPPVLHLEARRGQVAVDLDQGRRRAVPLPGNLGLRRRTGTTVEDGDKAAIRSLSLPIHTRRGALMRPWIVRYNCRPSAEPAAMGVAGCVCCGRRI